MTEQKNLELVLTTQFKKDVKRLKKRGKDLDKLYNVIDLLRDEVPLAPELYDHPLVGNYVGFRECHLESDWLLIYAVDSDQLILTASRSGSHSDLFE